MTDKPRRTSTKRPLVSAHPAFPAIVALWFAALLGIGSLVLPIVLFERASEASGLSSVFVAAQAPLGTTARMVIAIVASAIGIFVGLAIASRVAASSMPQSRSPIDPVGATGSTLTAKRPLSAREELGPGGIDAEELAGPIPGREQNLPNTGEEELEWSGDHALPRDADPLDHWTFLDAESAAEAESEVVKESETAPQAPADGQLRFQPESDPETDVMTPTAVDEAAPVQAERAEPGEPSIIELVDRFARALQQHRAHARHDAEHDHAAPDAPHAGLSAASPRDWAEMEGDEFLDEVAGEGYSSLLAMNGLSQRPREPAAIEAPDEAAACDRGQTVLRAAPAGGAGIPGNRAGRGDAESALRQALEKLQRMSGAA